MKKKLYRSRTDKKVTGVSGGLAEYFGIDPTLTRVIVFLLMWFTGIGLIAYILAAFLLPEEPEDTPIIHDDPRYTGGNSGFTPEPPKMPKAPKTPKEPGSWTTGGSTGEEGGSGSEGAGGYGDGSSNNNNNFKKY